MKKRKINGISLLFILLVGSLFLANFLPDKKYSDNENRPLKQRPTISIENYTSKQFQKDSETYLNDQFIGRDFLHSLKTNVDISLGKRIFEDVIVGKEDMLFQTFEHVKKEDVIQKATLINTFIENHSDLQYSMLLMPNKIALYEEYLPSSYPKSEELEDMNLFKEHLNDAVQMSDTYSLLKENKEEYLYYYSDHHWTTKAAYMVFNKWASEQGLETFIEYEPHIANENFFGTLSNRSGYRKKADKIELYLPKNSEVEYIVNYVDEEKETTSIYDSSKQLSSDPYAVFLGGNYPQIDIKTNIVNQNRLLLFKDSYANCMVEFLLPYYSEIVIIDPRYYYGDIEELILEKQTTNVLFAYNANTFFHDSSLEQLLK